MARLDRTRAILVVIDVQERLAPVIHEVSDVVANIARLIRGAHVLGVPVLLTEQYVKGLGSTVAPLREALDETCGFAPIEKMCFSSVGCADFMARLDMAGRRQVLIAGIEAHVCVFQTALDLIEKGYEVFAVEDAVSSRTARNRDIAVRRMVSEGAKIASTEMALFELTVTSGTDEFKAISRLVK
jgi:nicotinamidase-related amidase